jgi:predicted Zn-dependent peptidase
VEAHDLTGGATLYVLPAPRFRTVHLLAALRQVLCPPVVTQGALLPRVLRRGTRRFPSRTLLDGHLEGLYGASLRAGAAKMGDHQVIEVAFSCPGPASLSGMGAGEAADLPRQGAALVATLLSDPAPPELSFGALRPDYVSEEKDGLARDQAAISDERMSYAHYRCLAEMCRGEPSALHSLGRPADLGDISPSSLDEFRRGLLRRAPLAVYLAGPIDDGVRTDVLASMKAALRRWAGTPAGGPAVGSAEGLGVAAIAPRVIAPSAPHPRPAREQEILEPANVEQARLVIGLQTGITLSHAAHPAQVLYNALLGGFVHSRLFRRIREEAGLAYYAWSRVLATKGIILISCGIQETAYDKAVSLVRRELEALAKGDFTDAEFEAGRNSVLDGAKARLDSTSALIYGHLERVAGGQVLAEIAPWRELAQVTPEDAREFARRPVIDTVYLLGQGVGRPAGVSHNADEGEIPHDQPIP